MAIRPKPLVLIILDGWGHRNESEDNAITLATTPHWDQLIATYPHTVIHGSGPCVGLPEGQMGNSEVGHLSMGLGRVIQQDYTRINASISEQRFHKLAPLIQAIQRAQLSKHPLHVWGLVSPGGVHAHEDHFIALIETAVALDFHDLVIHAVLDGRDTPPKSATSSILKLEQALRLHNTGKIASLCGRYYAMDRDKRWERTEAAFNLFVKGESPYTAITPIEGLELGYARGESDEFIQPTRLASFQPIRPEDSVICLNFRADRARQLSQALVETEFTGFARPHFPCCQHYLTLTQYSENLPATVLFPPQPLNDGLGEILAKTGLRQLRIAETEKYAHVTFFFNGGIESIYSGEDRRLIPSPKVPTYDLQPEMSAFAITDALCEAIDNHAYDMIICNFANADMVGHTGDLEATIKAIEALDICLGRIHQQLLKVGGEALITADHGNAEQLYDPLTQQPHTAHTSEPVPLIYLGSRPLEFMAIEGKLADVAPTLLYLLNLPQPKAMTGHCLLKLKG